MITTRPATAADLAAFYPEYTCSFRAWVAEIDGEAKGIVGVALTRPQPCMFSKFDPELREHLKAIAILRLIKKAEAVVKSSKMPVLALAEPDEPTAPALLKRMGFGYLSTTDDGDLYGWGLA